MKLKLAALITAVLTCVSVVVGIGLTAPAAYAQQSEVCATSYTAYLAEFPCLNAWNGGPYLNTYTPGASHEDFQLKTVDRNGTIYSQIEYLPYGTCVGDAGGSSTNARAVMTDACNGANGYGGSYGTLFLLLTNGCQYGWELWNVHWGGLLSYSGFPYGGSSNNGDAFYLNTGGSYCMDAF